MGPFSLRSIMGNAGGGGAGGDGTGNVLVRYLLLILFIMVINNDHNISLVQSQQQQQLQQQQQFCSSFHTCKDCLTASSLDELCSWCPQTAQCIASDADCRNSTIYQSGRFGLPKRRANRFFKQMIIDSEVERLRSDHLLSRCTRRVDTLEQCVTGSEYAKLYHSFSTSARNLQPGGLQIQPVLPVSEEFLSAHVLRPDNITKEFSEMSMTEVEFYIAQLPRKNKIMVGSFLYNLDREHRFATPHVVFSGIDHLVLRANYSIERNRTLVVRETPSGKLLLHLLPSNIGIRGSPGMYHMGFVVATYNDITKEPVCLFYQTETPIQVTSVYRAILIGIYLYAGVPVFSIGLILALSFTCFCKFNDTKKISEIKFDDVSSTKASAGPSKQQQPSKGVEEEGVSTGTSSTSSSSASSASYRQGVSLLYYIKLNSDQVIAQCGLRGYYYWKYYRRLLFIVFLYSIMVLAMILPYNIVLNYRKQRIIDFAVTTFGSIDRSSKSSIPHHVVGVAFFVIATIVTAFSVKLLYYKRRYEASIFTARLLHLPKMQIIVKPDAHDKCFIENQQEIEEREKLLALHFNQVLQNLAVMAKEEGIDDMRDGVLSVNIVANMAHVMSEVDTQYYLESLLGPDPLQKTHNNLIRKARKKKLKVTRKTMIEKLEKQPIYSDQVFITFRSAKALRACKRIYKDKEKKLLSNTQYSDKISPSGVAEWKMRQCTWEPEDIKWDTMHDRTRTNVFRVVLVYVIYVPVFFMLMVALVLYFVRYGLYGLNSSIHLKQVGLVFKSSPLLGTIIASLLGFTSSVFSVFLTISGEVANLIMGVVSKQERMKSVSKESASYLLKSVSIIIPFYLTIPFLGDYLVALEDPESFYNNSGLALMQFILSYLFLYKGLELIGACAKVILAYFQNGREVRRVPFDYNVAYTSSLVIFFIIAVTGIRFPLLFVPGLAFFGMTYVIDSFLLLFFYEKAEGTGRIEFGTVTFILFVLSAGAMFAHPSLSVLLAFGSGVFVVAALSGLIFIIYLFERRGKKKSTYVEVSDEEKYAGKYIQPHLRLLYKTPAPSSSSSSSSVQLNDRPIGAVAFEKVRNPLDYQI